VARDYSALYQRRWEEAVESVFVRLAPRIRLRRHCAQVFADSIARADSIHAGRWGISFQNGGVRLNVGPPEALWWDEGFLEMMVHVATARQDGAAGLLRRLPKVSQGRYRSVPSSAYVAVPLDDAAFAIDCFSALARAHHVHVGKACEAGLNGMTRRGHHPGILDAIGRAAGRELPQPEYVPARQSSAARAAADQHYVEGARTEITQSTYERNREARRACLLHYGASCVVCGFTFGEVYGAEVDGLIHVHHIVPFEGREARLTNPITDLRPVCPNCHLVIHSRRPAHSLDDMRALIRSNHHNRSRL
jgi:5-methylcytosine-specific restriction enzyme A